MLKNNKVHEKSQTSNLKPQKFLLPLQPVSMFRIKKLDIFITKQFGLLFVGTFFICLFVLMMQFLWRYVDELIGKGLRRLLGLSPSPSPGVGRSGVRRLPGLSPSPSPGVGRGGVRRGAFGEA